ncbi:MAG TPA: sigma-70 family RNA polymerase sigma factor [Pyrinomonadaceae bacterium]
MRFFGGPAFPLRVDFDVECLPEITSEGCAHKSTFRLTHEPMRSEEPKQTMCIQDVLDDPEIQMRARVWAERLVRRYELAPMTGEDLYQQAITKLVRYAKSEEQREIEKPLSFMFIVLSNQARTSFQARAKTVRLEEEIPSRALSDNFEAVRQMELGILLKETFRTLDNDADREIFICVLNGYSSRQVAVRLAVSHVTVAHRMNQIRASIRKSLLNRPD